jgi:ABC-2 type transport system permease protein
MTGAIFRETLRRGWKPMLWWGLSLASLFAVQIVAVPSADAVKQMGELMETLPPFLLQMFGGSDIQYLATPEGYVAFQLFNSLFLLIFAVYAVVVGMNITANDEDRGIQDVVMALPIKRSQFVLEKLLAYSLLAVGVVMITATGAVLAIMATPALAVDYGRMLAGMLNFIPGTLLTLGFTAMIGALIRRRGTALGVVAGFIVISYFIDALGRGASETILNTLRVVSYYAYFDGVTVLQSGVNIVNVLVLLVAAVVFAGVSLWAYERRDIGL